MKNYYKILEIEPTATQEQIKSQHRLLLHAWHPDKFPNAEQKAKAEERIKEINEAYSVLGDPVKRQNYDGILRSYTSPPPAQASYTQTTQNRPSVNPKQYCQSCGLPAETKYVEFYENVGMVFMRYNRSVKGNLCKPCIDYYFWNLTGKTMLLGWWGVISFIVTPFILLNNLLRFVFSTGMKKPSLQIAPSPSPFWVFSAIGGFLFIGFFLFSMISSASAQPTSYSSAPVYPTNTPIYRSTQPPPRPTKRSITYNGITCVPWTSINESDVESRLCVYGKVYTYGPYTDKWSTIQFSSSSTAFRVMDFNYYYTSPLEFGDCVVVYGRIRDYGAYLIITPDKDAVDSIRVSSSEYCDLP